MYLVIPVYICHQIAKRGVLHTSSYVNLENHNLVIKRHTKLKVSPAIHLFWCFLLTKFQVSSVNQSEVMNRQSC